MVLPVTEKLEPFAWPEFSSGFLTFNRLAVLSQRTKTLRPDPEELLAINSWCDERLVFQPDSPRVEDRSKSEELGEGGEERNGTSVQKMDDICSPVEGASTQCGASTSDKNADTRSSFQKPSLSTTKI